MNFFSRSIFLIIFFIPVKLYAQDTVYVVRDFKEKQENPFAESLKKGKNFLSVGANIFTDVVKNQDLFTFYTIDETDRRFNVKLAYGYFVKDTHPIGIGIKYVRSNLKTVYETLLLDTVDYHVRNNDYIFNVFYGVTRPLFGSQRIYFISDPSIFFKSGIIKSDRTIDTLTDFSKTSRHEIALGLNVGVMFFLWKDIAATITIGPVGIGYIWEKYYLNNEKNGGSENFFLRMSPDIFNFQFTIQRYF